MTASHASPFAFAPDTSDFASVVASARFFMNPPRPHLTSMTRPEIPSANFLERIDAVMSGTLSTVAVTSRRGVEFFVRRATSLVWPIMPTPTFSRASRNSGFRKVGSEAGNGGEFIQGAAGVPEAASGHHRHDHPARRRERGENE